MNIDLIEQGAALIDSAAHMRGMKSERICREVKVLMIGGGSEEILKELAARQIGL
jgi:acyl-CoA dehydrogenase